MLLVPAAQAGPILENCGPTSRGGTECDDYRIGADGIQECSHSWSRTGYDYGERCNDLRIA